MCLQDLFHSERKCTCSCRRSNYVQKKDENLAIHCDNEMGKASLPRWNQPKSVPSRNEARKAHRKIRLQQWVLRKKPKGTEGSVAEITLSIRVLSVQDNVEGGYVGQSSGQ